MEIEMLHPQSGTAKLVSAPDRMSETPATYRRPPPVRGEHNGEVQATLGLQDSEIARLNVDGVTEGTQFAQMACAESIPPSGLSPPVPVPINGF